MWSLFWVLKIQLHQYDYEYLVSEDIPSEDDVEEMVEISYETYIEIANCITSSIIDLGSKNEKCNPHHE